MLASDSSGLWGRSPAEKVGADFERSVEMLAQVAP
jgi:hypothetical protein